MAWRKEPKARVGPVHMLSGSQGVSGRRGRMTEGGGLRWPQCWLVLGLAGSAFGLFLPLACGDVSVCPSA